VNCNYVKVLNRNHVLLKTIERGVGETPSCGSGAISTFLKLFNYRRVEPKILVEFTSGEKLSVAFRDTDVWLEGPVREVFEGKIG
jgi:diaminopimelate epimerase